MILEFAAVILGLSALYVVLKCLPPTKAQRWNNYMHEIDKEMLRKAARDYKGVEVSTDTLDDLRNKPSNAKESS